MQTGRAIEGGGAGGGGGGGGRISSDQMSDAIRELPFFSVFSAFSWRFRHFMRETLVLCSPFLENKGLSSSLNKKESSSLKRQNLRMILLFLSRRASEGGREAHEGVRGRRLDDRRRRQALRQVRDTQSARLEFYIWREIQKWIVLQPKVPSAVRAAAGGGDAALRRVVAPDGSLLPVFF